MKNFTRIILATAVAHCLPRDEVSRLGMPGFREMVAKTETFFSRLLTASS